MATIAALRATLAERFPDALPAGLGVGQTVATGIGPVDRLLPGGGLPRGRLTAWQAGGGSTAVLRSASLACVARGERAAWIDAQGWTTADGWVEGPLLLRPGGALEALVCAEELLRSGGFGLVVVTGAGKAAARCGVRLGRAAKAGGAALVVVGSPPDVAGLRVACHIEPESYRWRVNPFGEVGAAQRVRVSLAAQSLGWSGTVRFELPVATFGARRALDPTLADRRGGRKGKARQRRQEDCCANGAGGLECSSQSRNCEGRDCEDGVPDGRAGSAPGREATPLPGQRATLRDA